MNELLRAVLLFILGGLVALVIVVQLRGCGPTLGDQINQGICHRLNGAWDADSRQCILE